MRTVLAATLALVICAPSSRASACLNEMSGSSPHGGGLLLALGLGGLVIHALVLSLLTTPWQRVGGVISAAAFVFVLNEMAGLSHDPVVMFVLAVLYGGAALLHRVHWVGPRELGDDALPVEQPDAAPVELPVDRRP